MTTHEQTQDPATGPASMNDLLQQGMDLFAAELAQVGPSDWDRPTPCSEWTVADLVRHTADTADRVTVALQAGTWEPSTSTASPAARWEEAGAALRAQLAATPLDDQWPVPDDAPHGKFRFHGCDFAIHAWDLSVARGSETALPSGWVSYMDEFFRSLPAQALRRPRAFDEAVDPAGDDGPTRQLMAFLGRHPL